MFELVQNIIKFTLRIAKKICIEKNNIFLDFCQKLNNSRKKPAPG